jgi:hypothetical protein
MKQIFIAALSIIVACNTAEKKTTEDTAAAADVKKTPINTGRYTPTYSASFEMGDNKQAETILALWQDFDDGNLEPSKKYFADSVSFYFRDGSSIVGTRDSTIGTIQQYRDMYATVKSEVNAVFPVKSIDKNENWVLVWGKEVTTDKKGKSDSSFIQETWRFNKDGKVDLFYQYGMAIIPQKSKEN